MKTIIAILVAAVLFTSCSNGQNSTSTVDTSKVKIDTASHTVHTVTAVDTTKH